MPVFPGASSIPKLLPSVSIAPTTNFNQSLATLNSIVSANKYPTTVYFDYSTSSSFDTYTTVTYGSTVSGQASSVFHNITGLAVGTLYYVRCRATNAIGTTTSSSASFTTWSLKTYTKTTSGSFSVEVPSVTPTGGSAIAPTIYEMLAYGGGGGANYSGGGGGGYRIASSKTSSSTGTQTISGTVGAGGGGGNGGAGAGGASAGGSTTLTIGNTTYTAGGGQPANWLTNGGAAGTGDNTANSGGNGNYGYTYISGYVQVIVGYTTVCDAYDKNGVCTASHQEPVYGNDPNQPIYSTDYNRYAGGGGGGTDSAGGAVTYPDGGANGGNGGGAYGLSGGNGGRGGGTASFGSNGSTSGGGTVVGTGGAGWFDAGLAGGITFKYYGP